ncbi:chemotaxis phosphatase CheX-like protein [Mobilisporobacter senegalensis]|uniref:Stage 0 sporulation protein A homolog n=1 Tax=Mobilisporobacter senegalensis TaxID=1329262 RepID=A0A3N1XWP8_9FIRM|nr:response regulator [Mobilisporobacter senegalensis]ROR30631.1 chemotaxis phosphatase CheX-like protein [Mobilisporobacter senegalensis]
MEKIRIVIVDDSPFSITLLRDILEENGYEVVGDAGSLEEVKEVIRDKKPTLVTMDMTLPGTDGLECTRAIHEIDPNIKVIVVSSMMDEEIVKEAKENRVSEYIQKPVDPDELITAINRIMASEELYHLLETESFPVFKESLLDGVNRMTKTLLNYKEEYSTNTEHESKGLTVIIGIIGKFSGRMLIDLSKETAGNIAAALLRRTPKNNDEMVAAIAEFTNIISGNACSILNRKDKAYGLRVSPPSILYGDSVHISAPNFKTTTAIAETNFGEILINVGFTRGEEKWM